MFGEETNRLVEEALSARDAVGSARSLAKEKAAARQAAADEEATATAALQSSTADLDKARQAVITAITAELSAGDGPNATPTSGRAPTRPFLAPAGYKAK